MDTERWFYLVLGVLATWRLTHLLAKEDGPGEIFATLRGWLGNSFIGQLMDCFYCLSLWIAAPIAYLLMNKWREWPLLWLGLSGAACLLERPQDHPIVMQQIPPSEETR
ncbi:MAG: DUF1360 domain-containing protein [Terracidiphilus sp.]|jgi:hypothetical protein